MMIRSLIPAFLLVALVFPSPPAYPQTATKEKLQTVESQLDRQTATAAELEKTRQQTSDTLKELQAKLIEAAAALDARQEESRLLEEKQARLAEDITTKKKDLSEKRRLLAELTDAMLNLGRQPPASLVLETGLTDDTIHRSILLRAVLPRLRERTDSLAADLATLADLKSQMAEQQRLTAAGRQNLEAQTRNLDQLIRARQGLLQKTDAQKAALQTQLISLAAQAHDLRQLLEKVAPPKQKGQPPAAKGPSPALKWPVAGHVLRGFGDRDADGITSQGITFTALPGAPVLAPAAGKVMFAGPFKGYGQIVILQHKGGYHSFLAGLGRIDADVGQEIAAGEPLGTMPAKSDTRPELYFEWRRNADPVDPAVARAN